MFSRSLLRRGIASFWYQHDNSVTLSDDVGDTNLKSNHLHNARERINPVVYTPLLILPASINLMHDLLQLLQRQRVVDLQLVPRPDLAFQVPCRV